MTPTLSLRVCLLVAVQVLQCSCIKMWDCSRYYRNTTVTYSLNRYCRTMQTPPIQSLEGTDSLLLGKPSSRNGSQRIDSCAKTAAGRGFTAFVLSNNSECLGDAPVRIRFQSFYSCSMINNVCTNNNGYPCQKIATSTCQCGTGYGASNYVNHYTMTSFDLIVWIQIADLFSNSIYDMLNKTSPVFTEMNKTYTMLIETFISNKTLCGLHTAKSISSVIVRPIVDQRPGQINVGFTMKSSFLNATMLHESLQTMPIHNTNINRMSTQQITSSCLTKRSTIAVTVYFGKTSFTNPPQYQRDKNIAMNIKIYSYCKVPLLTRYYIKVAKISEAGQISNFTTYFRGILTNNTNIQINNNVQPYNFSTCGIHYAIVRAWTPEDPTMFGYHHVFMNITRAPIVAHIADSAGCVHALGQTTLLNGTSSYDKNVFESVFKALPYENDLNYTWVCYKSTDTVPTATAESFHSLNVVEKGVSISGATGGCFGSGVGRLKATTRKTYFESNSLALSQTIVFQLMVQKDDRVAFTTMRCLVVPFPPRFSILCVFNCGLLMKTTSRLGLRPFCDDPTGCVIPTLTHDWKLFIDTGRMIDIGDGILETEWQPITNFTRLTNASNVYFVLGENSLLQNRTYRAEHIVINSKKGKRFSNHIFTTNTLPHSGTCEANVTKVQAALDLVNITCRDWIDDELDFSYESWVLPHDSVPKLLHYGNASSFSLRLPLGDSSNDFTLKLRIAIFDVYENSNFFINLTVLQPEVEDPIGTISSMFDDQEGDDQAKAQLGIATASILASDTAAILTKSNKTQIRDSIISSMSNISANGTRGITQVSGVLIDSTSQDDELSVEAQEQSINAALRMSLILQNDNGTDDPMVFDETGTTLLHLTGNVINGAAYQGSSGEASDNPATNTSKLKLVAETAVNTSNTISMLLIGKMLGGEKPKTFLTPSLGLEIAKTESDKLPESYGANGGGVNVPSVMSSIMAESTKCPINETCSSDASFVSSKAMVSNSNPYTWGNSTIKVKSPVVSLEYLKSNGEEIAVGGLDTDFVIGIPTTPPKKPKRNVTYPSFLSPDADCVMHKFYIATNDTAFETIINLQEEKFLKVYVRYNDRPTDKVYDFMFHHPDLSSCVEPSEEDNCTGVYNFNECMGINTNETALKINETRCENFTLPNVGSSRNSTLLRDPLACQAYHEAVTCPPPVSCLNDTAKSCNGGSGINNLTDKNQTFENVPSTVCEKVQEFLDCKNVSLEKYESCKKLLTEKNLIYNKYEKCYKNIYRRFYGLHLFRKAGLYYISMCFDSDRQYEPTTPPTTPPTTTPTTPPTTTPTTPPTTQARTRAKTTRRNITPFPTRKRTTSKRWRWKTTTKRRRRGRKKRSFDYEKHPIFESDKLEGQVKIKLPESLEDTETKLAQASFDRPEEILNSNYDNIETSTHDRVLSRSRRETSQRQCAVVDEKPAPTTPPPPPTLPPLKPPVFNLSSSLNYSFDINLFTCLFWNKTVETWSTNGCKPHADSTPTSLVCMCNHLTSFGADMLVAPNPIDFDEVFANFAKLGETGNFTVLFTVIALFLLYGFLVILARKADKRDLVLVSKTSVGSIDPNCGGHNFEITVSTGTFRGSGTTANVAIMIHGELEQSPIIPLADETGRSEELLSRGNVVYFMVNTPEKLGDIQYIRIWHNNKGNDPAWFMRQITIRDVASNKKWLFMHNDWFAVDRADGRIDRRIYVATEEEKSKFKTLFYSHTAKSFSDKHLWISVVLRSPSNPFTRVQRLTCCFSLLLCAMLANAMFYQNDGGSQDYIQIGPIKLSLHQIIVGIESGLIVAPVNLLIITLFRKARPKTSEKSSSSEEESPGVGQKNDKENQGDRNDSSDKKTKKKEGFPHWCVYIGYILCVLSVLTSAMFVMFYSMMWGTDKSNEWMTSVVLSLIQDIVILQPLKVVILAMVLSFIFRKAPEEDVRRNTNENHEETFAKKEDDNNKNGALSSSPFAETDLTYYKPLDSDDVLDAQQHQTKKNALCTAMKDIGLHLVFVLLLSMAVFGSQSPSRYQLHKHLENIFHKSEKVLQSNVFWWWCDTVLLPGLYGNDWYNGQNFTDEAGGFISNRKAVLISMPRIRQARVTTEECIGTKDYPKLHSIFPTCYPDYSMSNADLSSPTTALNPNSSATLNDSVLNAEIGFERICLQPFMVQSAKKLGTLPYVSGDTTYGGGGLVADLGYDIDTAKEVLLNLKEDNWITRQTRIVLVEFIVFEPTSRLYAFARFSFEQKTTGAIVPAHGIEPYSLYGNGHESLDALIMIIQLILIIFIAIFIVKAIKKMVKLKMLFWKDFWNIHELAMLGFAVAMIALNFVRQMYIKSLIKAIQANPYSRMSFDYVTFGTNVYMSLASIVVFLATLKLLKLLNINKKILVFSQVMKLSKPFLLSYALIFFITFFAFAQMGNFIFGQDLPMYSTILRSFVNVFQMALGKGLFFHDLKGISTTMGPMFVLCYFMVTTLLLVNFFVAILNDSYADGSEKINDDSNEDAILAAFMSSYLKSSLKDISKDLKEISKKPKKDQKCQQTEEKESIDESLYFLY